MAHPPLRLGTVRGKLTSFWVGEATELTRRATLPWPRLGVPLLTSPVTAGRAPSQVGGAK